MNIKLLGGMAPTISLEQLIYDCRLMNLASQDGRDKALILRDWFVRSDSSFDPQAYILTPDGTEKGVTLIFPLPLDEMNRDEQDIAGGISSRRSHVGSCSQRFTAIVAVMLSSHFY